MMAVAKLHAAIRAALCLMEPKPSSCFRAYFIPSYYDVFDLKVMHSMWQGLLLRLSSEEYESRRIDLTDRLFDETLPGR